jgi:hypothetical protein
MNITLNKTSFELRGDKSEINKFLKQINSIDIDYYSNYIVVKNLFLYQHLPEIIKAKEIQAKQFLLFKE